MAWRPHGRARVDPSRPQAWATCDRCGLNYNLVDLQYQYQWAGTDLVNLRIKVCNTCLDVPAPFLKTIILPPDPPPVNQPRTEPYAFDEAPAPIEIGTGFTTWAGNAPTIRILDNIVLVSPGVGALTWTGYAPSIVMPVTVLPSVGEPIWTGYPPDIQGLGTNQLLWGAGNGLLWGAGNGLTWG